MKLDEAAKERRARAMAEARRGLHIASEPDVDAISVPDNNSPDMPITGVGTQHAHRPLSVIAALVP